MRVIKQKERGREKKVNNNKDGHQILKGDSSGQKTILTCKHCGRTNSEVCFWKTGACFAYGQLGHTIKDCPKIRKDTANKEADDAQKKKQKIQGCDFALIEKDAQVSNDVVTCTLNLFSKDARTLFNPSATYSFMSDVSLIYLCM